MAELRCPKCGRNNPDLLDLCQFCQTPLKSDSVLRIGDAPTKKNTGELEPVLPEWLRNVRQQAKSSAEEDAAQEAARPKVEKNEPPDLLAGLASQSNDAGDDDIPDWLASINPLAGPTPAAPAPVSKPEPESDFFAQFRQSEAAPASEPVQEEAPPFLDHAADQSSDSTVDELSRWFTEASEQPEEIVDVGSDAQPQVEEGWLSGFDSPKPSQPEPAPKEEEDLSWLHNLEEASKQTGDLRAPKQGTDWMANFEAPSAPSAPSGSQEDLSWLDNLAGIEEPQQPIAAQPFAQPPPRKEDDLGWLNDLGAASEPQPFDAAPEKPAAAQSFVSDEDLSWLSNLGAPAEPSQPAASTPATFPSAQEDLSWLNEPGETAEPSQPVESAPESLSSSQDDLSWLNEFGGQSGTQFTPPFAEPESTAQAALPFKKEDAEPDWLKSALETPSMPPPGDASLDWFTDKGQPVEETLPAAQPPQSAPFTDVFSTPGETPALSGQDLDSLFSAEMPDWLSRAEPTMDELRSQEASPSPVEGAESLAPVELPSWVQAMRPVEAVISESATGTEDEPEEKEGPLAGLRGVIPGMPIGSSSRPKSISLKLQVTDEQQAGAALLEQILGSETSPRALVTSPLIGSQRWLRWMLAGLFLLVLGAIVALRSTAMSIPSVELPPELKPASDIVGNIPEGGRVLVIVDYEPALAGEMEAVGGTVLSHVVLRHPTLSFVSTSSSGPGLVERLMTNTKINVPISADGNDSNDGFGYVAGQQYFNLGYLPGGSAGALGFVKGPDKVIPAVRGQGIQSLSDYSAVILMTDHAESGRVWVEQLYAQKQKDPLLTGQPLLVIASAQADPLLQPYVSSRQINGIVSGLSDGARYEAVNVISTSPKTA
ncbi:MAG TPA: hypothetical protein VFQ13_23755, partial [Anaerolineales bacterium]|nr:hypothetical protein [Anaerolineales bacterium]